MWDMPVSHIERKLSARACASVCASACACASASACLAHDQSLTGHVHRSIHRGPLLFANLLGLGLRICSLVRPVFVLSSRQSLRGTPTLLLDSTRHGRLDSRHAVLLLLHRNYPLPV
jgi:hypothetical protein